MRRRAGARHCDGSGSQDVRRPVWGALMPAPMSWRDRLERKVPRIVKTGQQWARVAVAGRRPATRVVFVVGSQRSGTRLPLTVMDHAPEIMTWSEGAAPYFRDVLLEPLDRVEQLVRSSIFPVVVLKPICETHRVHELLDRFPRSRAVWIFRHYHAAVNSASAKWKSGIEAVRRLAEGELASAGWRAGGLSQARLDLVRRWYRPAMSLHEANAVMWYLRNSLFFDLAADRRPEILLVRYEDLVKEPHPRFEAIFRFIDLPAPPGFDASVRDTETSRRPFPAIAPDLAEHCDDLHTRLMTHYSRLAADRPAAEPAVTAEATPAASASR